MKTHILLISFLIISLGLSAQVPADFREGDYIFYCNTFSDAMMMHKVGDGEFPNLWEFGRPYCVAAFDLGDPRHVEVNQENERGYIYAAQDIYDRDIWAVQKNEELQPVLSAGKIEFKNGRHLRIDLHRNNYHKTITFNDGQRLFFFILIDPNIYHI